MIHSHEYWMRRCLVLARKALGQTSPNPMVGSIVLDAQGHKVGEGFHQKAGNEHAETFSLRQAGAKAKGGTLYVNLEPCSIVNKQPPCSKNIIRHDLQRVVFGCKDSNPLISGNGIQELKEHGIEVIQCLEKETQQFNQVFFHWIQKKCPFVRCKVALSKNYKMGVQGKRTQISDPLLEKTTMKLRAQSDAILIGVETAMCDNPKLNVRGKYADRQPVRIIIDPSLRIDQKLQLFSIPGKIILVCDQQKVSKEKIQNFQSDQIEVLPLVSKEGTIQFQDILPALAKKEIASVLLEGGRKTLEQAHKEQVVDQWVMYQSAVALESQQSIPFDLPNWDWKIFERVQKVKSDQIVTYQK